MKRLSPEKRNKLILVVVATLTLIGLVYFLLIGPQNDENRDLATKTNGALANLHTMQNALKQADTTAVKAGEITALLGNAEADMASGDVFAWTYDTMRQFKVGRHIEITTIGQPAPADSVDMLPNFPYKQIRFQIMGNGYFHDIGKFAADLENKFPHMRIVSLTVDTAVAADAVSEKLAFRMEIAALVKPNS
jgi:Tfp pilus assembly protein PilO